MRSLTKRCDDEISYGVASAERAEATGRRLGMGNSCIARVAPVCTSAAVLTASVPFALLTTRAVQQILLAVILIELPLRIDVNLRYRDSVAMLGAIYGINISVMTVALGGLWFGWILAFLAGRAPFRIDWRAMLPMCLYLAAIIASVAVARDRELWLFETLLLLQVAAVHIWVAHWIQSRRDLNFAVGALLAGFVVESVLIAGKIRFSVPGISSSVIVRGELERSGGTLSLDNAGSYIALVLPVAMVLFVGPFSRRYRALGLVAAVIGSAALICTAVRGAWVAFAVSLVPMLILSRRYLHVERRQMVVLLVLLCLLGVTFSGPIISRITRDEGGTAAARLPLMEIASRIIAKNVTLGVGANNFVVVLPEFARTGSWQMWEWTVHNKYLLVWAETGVVGLVTFLLPLFIALRKGLRCIRRTEVQTSAVVIALVGSLTGRFAIMMSQPFHNRSEMLGLWLVTGLLIAVSSFTEVGTATAALSTYEDRLHLR